MEGWKARFGKGIMMVGKANDIVSEGESSSSSLVVVGNGNGNGNGNGTEKEETDKNPSPNSNPRSRYDDAVGQPPSDDCCPICFGTFTIPCKSICGHWYCGSCILQYWNYSAASKPCKCPMCASSITKLTPEASLYSQQHHQDHHVTKVLQNVDRYNRLFIGGALGLFQKVRESPLFIKRMFLQMMDPDRPYSYLHEMRLFAMMLSVLYAATPFNFIPTGGLGIVRLFDYVAIAVVLMLRLVGIYRRRRLAQRVRHLAAAQPLGEFPLDE